MPHNMAQSEVCCQHCQALLLTLFCVVPLPVHLCALQLQDNRNCVLCMTCLKACPHR